MARTNLVTTDHYASSRSESVFIITATVTDQTTFIPTQAELDASTTYDVTGAIADVSGWMTARAPIEVPINGSNSIPIQLSGRKTLETCSLTFWAGQLRVDIRTLLDENETVYVCFAPNGDTAASYMEVWKAVVNNVSRPKQFGDEPARVTVGFDIKGSNQNVLIPA